MNEKRSAESASERLERTLLHDHPAAWRISLLGWMLCGVLFLAVAVPPLRAVVDGIDEIVHGLGVSAEAQPMVTAARVLDVIGSVWVTLPIVVAIAIWLTVQRRWRALVTWLLATGLTQIPIGPLKDLYERPRPPQSLVTTTGYSFPSGHSVAVAAIAVAAVIVLVPAGPARRNLKMFAAGFAVLMALSRVYLRAHWLSDVAAGVALGVAIAVGVAATVQEFDNRRRAIQDRGP